MRAPGMHAAGDARYSADAVTMPWWRWALFAGVAAAIFAAALSGDVYDVTSPKALTHHVTLRKVYSIGAFAVVGLTYALARRRRAGVADTALAIAIYSGFIECGQFFTSDEPLSFELLDVACGAAGGALGALAARFSVRANVA